MKLKLKTEYDTAMKTFQETTELKLKLSYQERISELEKEHHQSLESMKLSYEQKIDKM